MESVCSLGVALVFPKIQGAIAVMIAVTIRVAVESERSVAV